MKQQNAAQLSPQFVEGYQGQGLKMDGDAWLDLSPVGQFDRTSEFTIGLWINIPSDLENGVILHQGEGAALYNYRGFHMALKDNRLEVLMAHNAPYNALVRYGEDLPRDQWIHLALRYNGSGKAMGLQSFLNGQPMKLTTDQDNLYKIIHFNRSSNPGIQIGARWRGAGIKNAVIDEIVVYDRQLSQLEILSLVTKDQSNTEPNAPDIADHNWINSTQYKKLWKSYLITYQKLVQIENDLKEVMVMDEMEIPRQTFILDRGQYNELGDSVEPGTPQSILPMDEKYAQNRLGLAEWLFDEKNPLTARVFVNRLWQQLFDLGLVKTSEDFGFQGSLPSHPELLDYLAKTFQEQGWNIKQLLKEIVMSSTYRQSSSQNKSIDDPDNVWLARGPAKRLTAEMMRDNVLAACGIMNTTIGGPSVKPYQPDGLWAVNSGQYNPSQGSDLYRRSLYTFWKRTVPNPTQGTFDAPDKSTCTVRRQKTSTPLQALVLLNDPTYLEAAKVFAHQMTKSSDHHLAIENVFLSLTGRAPNSNEINTLKELYKNQLELFNQFPEKADGWLSIGEYQIDPKLNKADLAANMVVASTIMNSESAISKS